MAIYTKVSHEEIEKLLSNYDLGKLVKHTAIIAGIQNSNYFIDTEKARYVLTIYENSLEYKDLPFFLKLMEHLAKQGVHCPLPMATKSGDALTEFKGKPSAIVSFVKGQEATAITAEIISELGQNLAKMHLAGKDFNMQRKNPLGPEGWRGLFAEIKNKKNNLGAEIIEEINDNLEFLTRNWPENLESGIIHGDLFPDNVLFTDDDKVSGIIDFYFSCNDYYIYDIAVCMNAWCFEEDLSFNENKANTLLKSYNKIRKITDEELSALPIIAAGAAMRFFLTRVYSLLLNEDEEVVKHKDPSEYLYKMKFHFNARERAEYILGDLGRLAI